MNIATQIAAATIAGGVLLAGASVAGATTSATKKCDGHKNRLEVVGLTTNGRLVCFSVDSPGKARTIGKLTGLTGDSRLIGIDFRPSTGALYGLGNAGGVYTVTIEKAKAEKVTTLNGASLTGTLFDIDFNPTVDKLRVVSDTGQNLRIDVVSGTATVDTALTNPPVPPAAPPGATATGVTGAAYTNNDTSADTATTLFDLNTATDQVAVQSPANGGTLAPTGKLGVDTSAVVGFDIYSSLRGGVADANSAFASLTVGGKSAFYRIDLLTGDADKAGTFRTKISDIAVPLDQG